MNGQAQLRIFLNYRADDTRHVVDRLFDELTEIFGSDQLFLDHRQIDGGEAWPERLKTEAACAGVLLVLIGANWLKAQNPITGDRRLNEPNDWVRLEIFTALESNVQVVPLLVDEARPLTPADFLTVPEISRLAEKQANLLRRTAWESDVAKLVELLTKLGFKSLQGHPKSSGESSPRTQVLARLAPPSVPHHFRGRKQEIQTVSEAFEAGQWCALVAVGGCGKTALAARIAADRSTGDPSSVVWLGLAGTVDSGVPQEWLANAVGASVRAESNAQQRSARLRGLTSGSLRLIVLDDPVSDGQLSELMASIGPGNDVLITAREYLGSMVPFGVKPIEVAPLPVSDATDILLSILGTRSVDTSTPRRDWEALAEAVGNHPLSLEVLAGDLLLHDHLRPGLYLKERVTRGTWSKDDTTLERLRKSLVESVARSKKDYEKAFGSLGAFEGSAFSVAAVTEVCGFESEDSARDFLVELRRRLCVRGQTTGLYSLHPFVSETARLVEAEGVAAARSDSAIRHIAFYMRSLEIHGGYEWNIAHYPMLVPEERELVHAIDFAASLAEATKETASCLQCAKMTALISWYLHWRGNWDLRVRLCERICAWAEKGLLPRSQGNTSVIVGNLYVDQGWIHLQRSDIDRAEGCAAQGQKWLQGNGDLIFAIELVGQVALRRQDYAKAIEIFARLRQKAWEGSRIWLVFSYRFADALNESGNSAKGLLLLEELLHRIEKVKTTERIDDVHARILYRVALQLRDSDRLEEAVKLARQAVTKFEQSGIIALERRAAVKLLADLLGQSGAAEDCRRFLLAVKGQAEIEGDFEMLTETAQRLAAVDSKWSRSFEPQKWADL